MNKLRHKEVKIMQSIQILRSQAESVSASIGNYIFKQLRSDGSKGMPWLLDVCGFYQKIRDAVYEPAQKGYLNIEVTNIIIQDMPDLISEYLPKEINELIEDDMDWLCELVSIYRQLINLRNKADGDDTSQIIKQKNEQRKAPSVTEKPVEQIPEKKTAIDEHIHSMTGIDSDQKIRNFIPENQHEVTVDMEKDTVIMEDPNEEELIARISK